MFLKCVILTAILIVSSVEAQQPPHPKLVEKEKYEEVLKNYTSWNENLSKPEFYKEKFKWKTEEGEKKFSDFTDFEKDQFYLIRGFQLTRELHTISLAWKNEITWLSTELEIPEGIATVEEIIEFQKQLLALRKKTAVSFEKLIDDIFEKHKDKILEKERDFVKKQIVNFHDKNKLIERKDDS